MKETEPILTVVIPVYNREHIVGRTLDSIAAQTLRPLDVIIVDNFSTDSTPDIINHWALQNNTPEFRVRILSEPVRAASAARRCGANAVVTPYVMFFDSDDYMSPTHCEDFARFLQSNPDVDIVGRDVIHTFLSGKSRRMRFGRSLRSHIFHASLATIRYAVRMEVLRRSGGWIDDVRQWDDYELGVRLLLTHPKIATLPGTATAFSYQTAKSITGTDYSSNNGNWENALDRVEVSLKNAGENSALRWVEMRRIDLAAHYAHEGRYDLSEPLLKGVLLREKSSYRRCIYQLAYHWVRLGLRGYALFSRLL